VLVIALHANLKRQNVLGIDRASHSVFVWRSGIALKKEMGCAGFVSHMWATKTSRKWSQRSLDVVTCSYMSCFRCIAYTLVTLDQLWLCMGVTGVWQHYYIKPCHTSHFMNLHSTWYYLTVLLCARQTQG
jgi:hypothetical protein